MSDSETSTAAAHVWPALRVRDADAFLHFMVDVVGFEESVVYRNDDGHTVQHAELLWPLGGGLMFGTAPEDDDVAPAQAPGSTSAYIVCDEPDALHDRIAAAGATILLAPYDTPYGSREFACSDPEGNRWSFGTYGGQPRP